MSVNPVIDDIAKLLSALECGTAGYKRENAEADALELLELVQKSVMEHMGFIPGAHAWIPNCGPGDIRVTITKAGEIDSNSADPERLMLILSNVEAGHMAKWVGLNKGISRYLRSTLAMIEDELPE